MSASNKQALRARQLPLFQPSTRREPSWDSMPPEVCRQIVFQKFELAAGSRRLSLEADFPPGLPPVVADVAMIERVMTNLLDNGIQATPAGGEVRVTLRPDGGRIAVHVSDTGPGIPEPLRAGLFSRPSAITAASLGRESGGLGLLIVQRILRLHGSDIELVDRPGDGTVFRFALQTG